VPPPTQPVAGQPSTFLFDATVDDTFAGGSLVVKTQAFACAASPGGDKGATGSYPQGDKLRFSGQLRVVLTLRGGPNVVCVWLVDTKGDVLAKRVWTVVARSASNSAATSAALLRGWNVRTVACTALTRAEAAQALGVPVSEIFLPSGGPFTGLTPFEQQYAASCTWSADEPHAVTVVLTPEQSPATLAYARRLYMQAGAMTKTRGPCLPVSGIGAAACVYQGDTGHGTIVAVDGHVVLQITVEALTEPAATIRAQEQLLARKALARIALAHR
jgi:hypothetical protein